MKIQISLYIRSVCSESWLGSFRIGKDADFFFMRTMNAEQTRRMRRLISSLRWDHMSEGTFSDFEYVHFTCF